MISRIVIVIILSIVFMNCGPGKRVATAEELEKVHAVVKMDTLKIRSQWANPLNANDIINIGLLPPDSAAGNINLIGNPNYFKIIGDSLSIFLPYYGRRQLGGTYNPSEVGIAFEGKPKVFKQEFNEKRNRYEYYFEVNTNKENLQINLSIFPNLRTDIKISSSHRTFISYSGAVVEESS